MLSLSMVVLGVSIKGHLSNLLQGIVGVGPDLGDVKHVELIVVGILHGHDLHEPAPRGEFSCLNGIVEIPSGPVLVLDSLLLGLFSSEVLNSLVSLEVVLDVVVLALIIHPGEGVGGVTIHVTVAIGGASV